MVSDGLNEMNCGVDADEMRMVCAFLAVLALISLSLFVVTVEWSVPQVHSYVLHRVSVKVSNAKYVDENLAQRVDGRTGNATRFFFKKSLCPLFCRKPS
jgi:hypothetical protein